MKNEKEIEQLGRIAWLYYVKGLSQDQIAGMMHFSRAQVQRRIVKLVPSGIVEIRINHGRVDCFELEDKLRSSFHLVDAIVAPSAEKEKDLKSHLGKAAAYYLQDHVADNSVIGVGMGTTLRAMIPFLEKKSLKKTQVVSLLGSWPKMSSDGPYEVASKLAGILGADCYYISAPAVAESMRIKETILTESRLKQAFDMAVKSNLIIVGIGNASPNTSLIKAECLTLEEVAKAQEMGAVGDILGYYFNSEGQLLKLEFMDRIISIDVEELRKHRMVIGVAGGKNKTEAVFGALRGGFLDVLITDEDTAKGLLEKAAELMSNSPK